MRFRSRLLRILRASVVSVVALTLLAFAIVQMQQRIFRRHAERLLADFQSIRLQQSTWRDAQTLMQRWGAWGKYEGTCATSFCDYKIQLIDPQWNLGKTIGERLYDLFIKFHGFALWDRLGDHGPKIFVEFTVSDGYIVQSSAGFGVEVPPRLLPANEDQGLLIAITADSRFSLSHSTRERGKWHLGNQDQLLDHPDYEVTRPGGCMFCEIGEITYTPYLPQSEIDRLTAFNLGCITRLHPCSQLSDLLPAAASWNLYDEDVMGSHPQHPVSSPQPCRTALRAMGRDAEIVVEVEVLDTETKVRPALESLYPATPYELSSVRVLNVLKNFSGKNIELKQHVEPYAGDSTHSPELLLAHRSYFLLTDSEHFQTYDNGSTYLDSCGVLEATPKNLAALQVGFAQDKPPQSLLTERR